MPSKKNTSAFANTLAELETLASRLEKNDTPLEQSLKDFETGIQLIQQAQKSLMEAEQRVQILLEKDGAPTAMPLEDEEIGEDEDRE